MAVYVVTANVPELDMFVQDKFSEYLTARDHAHSVAEDIGQRLWPDRGYEIDGDEEPEGSLHLLVTGRDLSYDRARTVVVSCMDEED